MNKCLLEVAMCEKCRNSDFQSEEGRRVKSLSTAGEGGLKNFRTRGGLPINLSGGRGTFAWGSVPYYMQYNFHLPNDHFNCAKSKNNFYSRYRVTTRRHFWTQYGSFAPNNFFFLEIYYHSHLPISSFHCVKSKKTSSIGSRVMRMWNFGAQNDPFPQMIIFFRKPVNEPCFFHSYLSTSQKLKSDINLLVKY